VFVNLQVQRKMVLLSKLRVIEKYLSEKLISFYISIFAISESVVNPFPLELLLIPSIVKYPHKYIKYAFLAALMSTIGAVFGYILGYYLEEKIIKSFVDVSEFIPIYEKYGALIILIGAITPLPFKIVTVASGVFKINFIFLIIYSFIGRYIRYQIIALLTYYYGSKMINAFQKINNYSNKIKYFLLLICLSLGLCFFIFLR
jgi:membrane protein YqaA with SNARE-associated domain